MSSGWPLWKSIGTALAVGLAGMALVVVVVALAGRMPPSVLDAASPRGAELAENSQRLVSAMFESGMVRRVDQHGNTVRAQVTPLFEAQDYEDKRTMASALSVNGAGASVVFVDVRTGAEVGRYDPYSRRLRWKAN